MNYNEAPMTLPIAMEPMPPQLLYEHSLLDIWREGIFSKTSLMPAGKPGLIMTKGRRRIMYVDTVIPSIDVFANRTSAGVIFKFTINSLFIYFFDVFFRN